MPDLLTTYAPHREELYSAVLADVLDGLGHRNSALPPTVRPLRQEWRLFGRAVTLSAVPVAAEPEQPYAKELECIASLRPGGVLVATTNGALHRGLWGVLVPAASLAPAAVCVLLSCLTR